MAAPQGRQSAAGDCCGPGGCSGRQPATPTLQVPPSCAAARLDGDRALAPLLNAAAACIANELSASSDREEAAASFLLLLQSSSQTPTAAGHKRDTPASGAGGSVTSRKQVRPSRPKPSELAPMRVMNPISPGSLAKVSSLTGWDPLAEEPSLVDHGQGKRHAERHVERTAVAAPKQRQVRPISRTTADNTMLKCQNTGFWPSHVFFPGQPGGQSVVKNPLDHQSVAAVKLCDCKSTRCRAGGCCAKLSELEVLEVRQEFNNGCSTSPSSDPEQLRAVVQAARNDQVGGGYDTVKISLRSGNPVEVCLPAWALIAGFTGAAVKKALATTCGGSLVPFKPQLHAREQEAQATQLARSYIHDVLVIAHENQPVAALGCSSGKQTCLVKQPWKVRAVAERRSNTPSDRTAREHTPCVPHYPSSL